MRRFAIYYAPADDSPLRAFGSRWLGRDTVTGASLEPPVIPGLTAERHHAITAAPRRYGFHATLKPPFRLAAERDVDELLDACRTFAAACEPFEIAGVRPASIDGFIALVLSEPSEAFHALAAQAVRVFDCFRAPPAPGENEGRMHAGLSARERANLEAWGYPYVFDAWRFHLTLTERVDDLERALVLRALTPLAAPFDRAQLIDAFALFEQPQANEPFRQIECFTFPRVTREKAGSCP